MALLLCLQMTEYTQSIPELRTSFLRSFVLSFVHVIDYALIFSIVNFNTHITSVFTEKFHKYLLAR